MASDIGIYSLLANLLLLPTVVLAAMVSAKFDSPTALRWAKRGLIAHAALLTLASGALMYAFLNDDFRLDYVYRYSEQALPSGYKVAAFWAGQPGSLLLWAWILAVMGVIGAYTLRAKSMTESAGFVVTMALACAFFVVLMLFVPEGEANPFHLTGVTPPDGRGLNPLLQDPWMISHPPTLFLGYAGFTLPFAMMIGALVAGRRDAGWLGGVRIWSLMSWIFLTLGIILGARWAYVELGWGGYWAWDPVENASLLPWLIGTALLHSIMPQQHRGQFKIWNVGLITAAFLLCIFGTYVVRSGVVASVHSFGESPIGWFFLIYMGFVAAVSTGLILWRLPLLRSERPLEALTSKEGAFLLTNILLVAITAVTFIGTMYPVLSRMFGQSKTVEMSFYNAKVMPMALVLVAMMAIAPLLAYGREGAAKLMRRLAAPVAVGILLVLVAALTGLFSAERISWTIWTLLSALVVTVGAICIGWDLVRSTIERMKTQRENVVAAALRLLDTNHRRYGGMTVHLGVLMIAVGIVGSNLFQSETELSMRVGDTVALGRYEMTFEGHRQMRGPNYIAESADVALRHTKTGKVYRLHPEVRKYDKWDQLMKEVAIHSDWRNDLFMVYAGHDARTDSTAIRAMVNPLVSWIWMGCWVMTVGGVVCVLPRLEPKAWRAVEPTTVPEKARVPAGRRRQPVGA